jgi:hypothetical protein
MRTLGGWIYCDKCGERTVMLSGTCPDCEKKEKEELTWEKYVAITPEPAEKKPAPITPNTPPRVPIYSR